MFSRDTGGLSQLLLVKMNWKKNSKKKPMTENNFYFLVEFILSLRLEMTKKCILCQMTPPPLFCQIPKYKFFSRKTTLELVMSVCLFVCLFVCSFVMPFQLYRQSTFSSINFLTNHLYSSLAQLFTTFKTFRLVF